MTYWWIPVWLDLESQSVKRAMFKEKVKLEIKIRSESEHLEGEK